MSLETQAASLSSKSEQRGRLSFLGLFLPHWKLQMSGGSGGRQAKQCQHVASWLKAKLDLPASEKEGQGSPITDFFLCKNSKACPA